MAHISDFDDAILFTLQENMKNGVDASASFKDIWTRAAERSRNFNCPISAHDRRRQFTARLLEALEMLVRIEFIAVHTNSEGAIEKVDLLEGGRKHLTEVQFVP